MSKMRTGLLVFLFLLAGNAGWCQFGHYASAVYVNANGGSFFYNNTAPGLGQDIGSNTFQGTDFGIFEQNSGGLKIAGSEIKTFKGMADNVCAASLNYTVYPVGIRPASPIYSSIPLGFYSDCFAPACGSFFGSYNIAAGGGCCSERDQKWQNPGLGVAVNIDLTANPIGTYTFEIYYSYTGQDGGSGCGTTKYDNNNSNPVNYTAAFTITAAVPVSFGTVQLVNNSTSNNLSWYTYSEADTKRFSVERSANGVDFDCIGQQPAAGSSSTIKHYSFTDERPLKGINFYRVKSWETNGRFQNSVIVNTVNKFADSWYIVTNPVKDNLLVEGLEKGDQVIVFNAYGAEITRATSNNNLVNIPVYHIANGTYYIKLTSKKSFYILPVVIVH
ncbi:MAG: T9SS type A sorting domain-containing protein [Ferruginibacter sp.]|nr:T9SS type A sorting domain-containing protein [Ferruginibacter sp.]